MSNSLEGLKQRLAQLADLAHASALANWDQQTMMPPGGVEARAESLATLARISHEMYVDPETGRLLEGAEAEVDGGDADDDDVRLIALVRRRWEKARRVPPELAADIAKAASIGQERWIAARTAGDFAAFAPYLQTNIDLARKYVECQHGGPFACGYDVLLDDYEPQMSSRRVTDLFAELKSELVPLIRAVAGAASELDGNVIAAHFPVAAQRRLVREVVGWMGFDGHAWRMDDTVHPFATRIGTGDVRITTRWDEHYFPMGLYGAMHECGHGLYEAGLPVRLRRTPLGASVSLGVHESQSRLWENMVGRGRPLCEVVAPRVAALAGGELSSLTPDRLYRAVNRVKPSFIRVEADEATYALHIILRYELEQALIDGSLSVADLPEAWNTRFADSFGLEVTNDADGVLQDVHWSGGAIGYFPTYALGNLIAGQLWERARLEIPDLEEQMARGELGVLREWLGRRVHQHGSRYTTDELLERETGAPIAVGPFIRYLKDKLADVYRLDLTA